MEIIQHMGRWIDRAAEFLNRVLVWLAGLFLVSMMLIICINVFIRHFTGTSWAWTIEMSEYLMLYITFLVVPWVLRHYEHITFDLVYANVSPRTKRVLDIIVHILGILICVILTVYGFETTWDHYVRNIILYNTLFVPKFILLLVIPVSGLLMLLEFCKKLLRTLRASDAHARG